MKANELMIGDWVRMHYPFDMDIDMRPERINVLTKGVDIDCEAIPLTSEILEKNGFSKVGDDIWQLDVKSHWFWIDFNQYIFGCDLNTSTNEQENSFRILCLSCNLQVHELQHALRLCGIDKEIVL